MPVTPPNNGSTAGGPKKRGNRRRHKSKPQPQVSINIKRDDVDTGTPTQALSDGYSQGRYRPTMDIPSNSPQAGWWIQGGFPNTVRW